MPEAGVSGVLFSAGRGTRLRPLTDRIPKAVLPMLDIPLGAFGLERLLGCCSNVVVNVDAAVGATVAAALQPMMHRGLVGFVEESPAPFGSAGTLASIREELEDIVITWNADVISNLNPGLLLQAHRSGGAPATIAVAPVDAGADVTYRGGRATAYIDRRVRPEAGGGLFLGMAVLERSVVDAIPRERPLGVAEAVLGPLTRRGELAVYEHPGYTIDVGTFPRYLEASLDVLEGRAPAPPLELPGEVVVDGQGRAYISPGSRAAEGTLGAGAILLQGSQVRTGAFVERAVVWSRTVVPEGEVVRDRVWF